MDSFPRPHLGLTTLRRKSLFGRIEAQCPLRGEGLGLRVAGYSQAGRKGASQKIGGYLLERKEPPLMNPHDRSLFSARVPRSSETSPSPLHGEDAKSVSFFAKEFKKEFGRM